MLMTRNSHTSHFQVHHYSFTNDTRLLLTIKLDNNRLIKKVIEFDLPRENLVFVEFEN
jgi:hypothetical protein